MAQVSRNPIHKDVHYQIRDDFVWILSALRSIDEAKSFYYDFFTKTERMMFAKRLAVAMMLEKELTYQDIRSLLHVSTSTISRVSGWLDRSGTGVKQALDKLIREERMTQFWEKVDRLLEEQVFQPYKHPVQSGR
jgi:TrpR-related protein YerC/YecD